MGQLLESEAHCRARRRVYVRPGSRETAVHCVILRCIACAGRRHLRHPHGAVPSWQPLQAHRECAEGTRQQADLHRQLGCHLYMHVPDIKPWGASIVLLILADQCLLTVCCQTAKFGCAGVEASGGCAGRLCAAAGR